MEFFRLVKSVTSGRSRAVSRRKCSYVHNCLRAAAEDVFPASRSAPGQVNRLPQRAAPGTGRSEKRRHCGREKSTLTRFSASHILPPIAACLASSGLGAADLRLTQIGKPGVATWRVRTWSLPSGMSLRTAERAAGMEAGGSLRQARGCLRTGRAWTRCR